GARARGDDHGHAPAHGPQHGRRVRRPLRLPALDQGRARAGLHLAPGAGGGAADGRVARRSRLRERAPAAGAHAAPVAARRELESARGSAPPLGRARGARGDSHLESRSSAVPPGLSVVGSASASAVAGYVYDPASIPGLQLGDVVNLASSTAASVYDAMGTTLPAGSVVVAAVVAFDTGAQQGTVCGFATVRIDKVDSRSNPKFIDARLVALDPPTLAQ